MDYLCDITAENLIKRIKKGEFGKSGEKFMTVRRLADAENISLVTAQQVMTLLKSRGFVEHYRKNNYLTYEKLNQHSALVEAKPQKEKLIGIHVTNIRSPFFSALIREIEEKAAKAGYRCITATSSYNPKEEKEILSMFRRLNVSGVITTPGRETEIRGVYQSYTLPCVFVGYRYYEELKADSVMVDNFAAGEQVAAHFVKEGYEKFIYIGLSEVQSGEDPRLCGFAEGIKKAGFSIGDAEILRVGANELERVRRMLTKPEKPTAVFCYHDLIAIEVLRFCEQYGIKVPEQMAIAGFDNLDITKQVTPQLTTVKYNLAQMAETAVRALTEKIESDSENYREYYIPPILAVRGSSGKQTEKTKTAVKTFI